MRRLGEHTVRGRTRLGREEPLVEQAQQGHAPDPEPRLAEEVPPRDRPQNVARVFHDTHSFVSVSSRFKTTLATMVQAAFSVRVGSRPSSPAGIAGVARLDPGHRSGRGRVGREARGLLAVEAQERCDVVRGRLPRGAEPEQVTRAGLRGLAHASFRSRIASARAAAKNAGSLRVVSAWSGVLVRTLLTVQNSREGASKVVSMG